MPKKYSLLGFQRQLDNHILNDKNEPVIDVWHGGHPNIDKFDMSAMGTGEGAQAYSPGLYNAQRKGVAGDYRDAITARLTADMAHEYGLVTIGGITIPVSARNWIRIDDENASKEDLYESLTSHSKFERTMYEKNSQAFDWESEKKRMADERLERQSYDDVERLASGEASYEDEMLYHYGPDWKDEIGYEAPDDSDFNINPGGFFMQVPNGDDVYVRIEGNKTFYDHPGTGEEVVTEYPVGTEHDFMEFDHEAANWLGNAEDSFWITDDPKLGEVGKSYQLAYEFASDGQDLNPNGSETVFRFMKPTDVAPNNPFGPTPISTRRMNREGTIIDELSPAYYAHMKEANEELATATASNMNDVAGEISNGSLPVWDQEYMPLPDSSNMRGGLYRNHLHVDPDELLDWFEPIGKQPKKLQDKIRKYFDSKIDEDMQAPANPEWLYDWRDDWTKEELWEDNIQMTGKEFFQKFSEMYGGRHQFRQDMEKIGMPGVIYQDYTRNSGRGAPTYNFVMYSDDPIEIVERGAATAPMLASVFAVTSAGLASAIAGKQSGLFDTVLDPDIAERFPMPKQPDTRSGLDKVLEHNGFLTPYVAEALQSDTAQQIYAHPVSQYIGQQFDNAQLFPRGLLSAAEGIYNSAQGMPAYDTLVGMYKRLQTPLADTAEEAGQATLKATGSPALATGANMGIRLMEP